MIYAAFNKPYGYLSQFKDFRSSPGLSSFSLPKGIYPCGRLDLDSEGLLILSDDGIFNQKVSNPKYKKEKTYWVQVEGEINQEALQKLKDGVSLKDGPAFALKADKISQPNIAPRVPPIRERKTVPASWAEIIINEGRNRQVRRMMASVGFPVLRLFRYSIGIVTCEGLSPGQFRYLTKEEVLSFR